MAVRVRGNILAGAVAAFLSASGQAQNERIRVKSLMDGRRFLYEIVKLYADGG